MATAKRDLTDTQVQGRPAESNGHDALDRLVALAVEIAVRHDLHAQEASSDSEAEARTAS